MWRAENSGDSRKKKALQADEIMVSCIRTGYIAADLAQLAEQLFCKQQVRGSSPLVGSTKNSVIAPERGPSGTRQTGLVLAFTPVHTPKRSRTPANPAEVAALTKKGAHAPGADGPERNGLRSGMGAPIRRLIIVCRLGGVDHPSFPDRDRAWGRIAGKVMHWDRGASTRRTVERPDGG